MRVAKTTSDVSRSWVVWQKLHARWCKEIHSIVKKNWQKLHPRCRKYWRYGKSYTLGAGNTGAIMIPTRSMQYLQFFLKFDTRYEVLSRSVKTSSFVVPWIRRACRSLSLPLGSSLAKGKMGMGHGHFPLVSLVRADERKRRKTKKQTNEPTNIHIPYQYVLNH